MRGVALAQIAVKASRVCVWAVLATYFKLWPMFCGRFCVGGGGADGKAIGAATENAKQADEDEEEEEEEEGNDAAPLFSLKEFKVYLSLVGPMICTLFSGWFIFELQIICLAHIHGINANALAREMRHVQ